jgi:hypothetical protein
MSKFKVGDTVKILHSDWPNIFPVGSTHVVRNVDSGLSGCSLGLDNEEYYFFNREVKLVNKVVATNTADISNVTIEATYKVKFQVAGEEFEIAVSDSNCVKLARLLEVLG